MPPGAGSRSCSAKRTTWLEGTSSRSGKLVHGGLRYLEYYEFRLVREALIEREVLLNAAPHIIWPMRFVLPHSPQDRPAWLVRLGLFLYDHLGGREKLPGTRTLNLRRDPEGAPILDQYTKGFEYSDCWVDDARLVVLNAVGAAEKGAVVLTRTAAVSARRENGAWTVTTRNSVTGETRTFRARCLVNCAGPWVTAGHHHGRRRRTRPATFGWSRAATSSFQNGGRDRTPIWCRTTTSALIFINPYDGDLALIGTTDIAYDGRAEDVAADETEIDYLLAAVNRYFKEKLRRSDVLHSFSGVRPLFDDGKGNPSAVTRDYVFDLDETGGAPLLNVFGGKITTYRELAERGLHRLKPHLSRRWAATGRHSAPLPGGEMPNADYETFANGLRDAYPWMPRPLLQHYGRLYGARTTRSGGQCRQPRRPRPPFRRQLYEAEVRYLVANEWAQTRRGCAVPPHQAFPPPHRGRTRSLRRLVRKGRPEGGLSVPIRPRQSPRGPGRGAALRRCSGPGQCRQKARRAVAQGSKLFARSPSCRALGPKRSALFPGPDACAQYCTQLRDAAAYCRQRLHRRRRFS